MKKNMKSNFLFKSLFLIFAIVLVVSCDKDFNEIGSDLVGDKNFEGYTEYSEVEVLNQVTGPVQTNDLPINSLGYLKNTTFGNTTSSFVTQLELGTEAPEFYDVNAVTIDSIYLHVPYFSHITTTSSSDTVENIYALDSVIGTSQIKLDIYRSGYYLRDFEESTGFVETQKYYSNQQPEIDLVKGDLLFEKNNFTFDSNERLLIKSNGNLKERLAPGIYCDFDATMKTYFLNNIIKAPKASLINNNAFKQYFRGLYFKAENAAAGTGAMARVNFAKGKIVIVYHCNTSLTDFTKVRKELVLNMKGKTVNFFQNDSYTQPVNNDKIELKGGEGSMAVLKLFNGERNNLSSELKKMRDENWLINEASITFNIDETDVSSIQPKRIYLYDLQNKRPIIDYYYDSSTATNSKYNKYVYGGILVKDNGYLPTSSERGTKYKIRITNYLRSLVKNGLNDNPYRKNIDSTNVKLGLVVTEAITNPSNAYLKNVFSFTGFDYLTGNNKLIDNKHIPVMSVVNPLGVRLHGGSNSTTSPNDKKIKLEIKYTKPN